MKKLSYLLPLLFIFCCVQQNKYTPFIDIQLLNGIKVGDHKNKIQSYLGEPLIIFSKEKMTSNKVVYKKQSVVQILMDSNAQEIWEYHYICFSCNFLGRCLFASNYRINCRVEL